MEMAHKKNNNAPLRGVIFMAALAVAMLTPSVAKADWLDWFRRPGDKVVWTAKDIAKTFGDTALGFLWKALWPFKEESWSQITISQLVLAVLLMGLTLAWALIPTAVRTRTAKLGVWAWLALLIPTLLYGGWAVIVSFVPRWLVPLIVVGLVIVVVVGLLKTGLATALRAGIPAGFHRIKGYSQTIAAADPTWTAALPGALLVAAIVNSQWLNGEHHIPRALSAIAGVVTLLWQLKGRTGKHWTCTGRDPQGRVCGRRNKKEHNFCSCGAHKPTGTYVCSGRIGGVHCKNKVPLTAACCQNCGTPNPHLGGQGPRGDGEQPPTQPTAPTAPPNPPLAPPAGARCTGIDPNTGLQCTEVVLPQDMGCGTCGTPNPAYGGGGGATGGGNTPPATPTPMPTNVGDLV